MKKKLVVLTGAGISAESGLKTFRDADGLWEGYRIEDVATPEAWYRDPEQVLRFYNERRKAGVNAMPNEGHLGLVRLEKYFEVSIITQNIDNLHEKAGSSNVIHLHGEIFRSRSTANPELIYEIEGWELNIGDKCEKGSQLRPHIVWFGEAVPMMDIAIEIVEQADFFAVIGTSLLVYPAAALINYPKSNTQRFIIDPKIPEIASEYGFYQIPSLASQGVLKLEEQLIKKI